MNTGTLTRQAIRLAQRESAKLGRSLTRDEVLKLHVQTVEPWKRLLFVTLGLSIIAFAVLCYLMDAPWWIWIPFGLGGTAVVVIGTVGKKAYLARELGKLHDEGPTRVADAILNALL